MVMTAKDWLHNMAPPKKPRKPGDVPRTTLKSAKGTPDDLKARIVDIVIDRMTNHGYSCFRACRFAKVPQATFLDWVNHNKDYADRYARARLSLIEFIEEEAREIVDEPVERDPMTGKMDSVSVQDKKLRADHRKWVLAVNMPKKYGTKVELSGDESAPVAVKMTGLAQNELDTLEALLAKAAGLTE
jgi:hypothetical protein